MSASSLDLPTSTPPDRVVRLTRTLAVTSLVALVLLCLVWELWLAPTGRGSLAIKALPLTLALSGLLKYRLYTYRWVSLLVWLYCTEGLVRVSSDHGVSQVLAGLEVLFSVGLFMACAIHVRWRLKHRQATPEHA